MKANKNYDYLNSLKKKLDESQRQVCLRTENTVVGAGAGSGKTQTLATRFAWLVMSEKVDVSEILTLTFTKKAAAEMYERIYNILKFFAYEAQNVPEAERNRARKGIEKFSEVHIQTLDSYCTSLLRQCANRYGIKPDFISGSENLRDDVKKIALPFLIQNRNSDVIRFFSKEGQLENFANEVIVNAIVEYTSLASENDCFSKFLEKQREIICNDWNNQVLLKKIFDDMEDVYVDLIEKDYDYDKFMSIKEAVEYGRKFILENKFFITNTDEKYLMSLRDNAFFDDFIDDINEIVTMLKDVKFRRDKQSEEPARIEANKRIDRIKSLIKYLEKDFIEVVNSLTSYLNSYEYIKKLYEMLDSFLQEVNNIKRSSGNLSFFDITEMALKILIEQKDIRNQEKNAYSKIMIDEFQDNNGKNRDLLFLLSEKKDILEDGIPTPDKIEKDKLFFVGDEKQSIYRFRGADVAVFNSLKHDLGEENYLQMVNNYRSDNALIQSFNIMFGSEKFPIFKPETNLAEDELYEATYKTPAVPINKKSFTPDENIELTSENVKTHICLLNETLLKDTKDNKDSKDKNNSKDNKENSSDKKAESEKKEYLENKDQIAYCMAEKIKTLYDSLPENEKSYSKFAILAKSRTNYNYFTKWLNYFSIPYALDLNKDIFNDGPGNDICSFLRLCVYPSDMKNFAIYLASPFVGMSFQGIETILALSVSTENNFSAFNLNCDELLQKELSPNDYQKYIKAKEFYDEQKPLTLKRQITETLNILWQSCGYYYETLHNEKVNLFSPQYDLIYEYARKCDQEGKNVGSLIDCLENNLDDLSETTYPLERSDAVKIMTIFKSKGLEFDYVFAMGCMNFKYKNENSKTFYEEDAGLSITNFNDGGNYFYLQQKALSQKKQIAEFRRLIYVAATRASKELFFFGSWNPKTLNEDAEGKLLEHLAKYYYPRCDEDDYGYGKIEYTKSAPFDFYSMVLQEKDVYLNFSTKSNNVKTQDLIEALEDVYENCDLEKLNNDAQFERIAPSSLELDIEGQNIKDDLFKSVNKCFTENFSSAEFGTLVHSYMEYFVNNCTNNNYNISNFIPDEKLIKPISEKNRKIIFDTCFKMVELFADSEFGKKVVDCQKEIKFCKSEYLFKMFQDNTMFTGSIDLIYEDEDGFTIVDFKTDSALNIEKYVPQQNCYKKAAQEILNVEADKIKCYLYFLRNNEIIDLSKHMDCQS